MPARVPVRVDWQLLLTSGSVFFVLESRINAITAPRNANMILELSPSTSLVSIQVGEIMRLPVESRDKIRFVM